MLKPGANLPDVLIPATPGLCETATPLADLLREGPLVIYSYPADHTPLCTRQACIVRDAVGQHADDLRGAGIRVVGISPQDQSSHDRFASKHDLPFPIIADEDKAVLKALQMLGPLGIPRRVTYLLLRDGTVGDAMTADLMVGKHAGFIRRAVAAASAR